MLAEHLHNSHESPERSPIQAGGEVILSDSGGISKRAIAIQLVIIAGLVAFLKFYVPRMEKNRQSEDLEKREGRIESLFKEMVVEDSSRTVEAPGSGETHPQSLRSTPSVQDVDQALGGPDTSSTDYAGGLHLTWIGTKHSLEASFNHGRLYCLTLRNRSTGHGASVFESSANWQAF
jgi:hypothetical protein